jgi:uncharacterized protein YdhG (YjbR/CyaY superfamily)
MTADDAVLAYVDGIDDAHRGLFLRLHGLVLETVPEAEVGISYDMPTYRVGKRRLYLAAWKHGVSIYGWSTGKDGGFAQRHPALKSGAGTIKLRPADAAQIPDDEFRDLARAALSA